MAYCERCDRSFGSYRALWQHRNDSGMHHVCDECDRDFATPWALKQHFTQSPRHPYCQRCEMLFDDYDDLYEHYDDDHYYCDICIMIFDNENGLHGHRRQKHSDRYCVPCKRMFQSANNLDNHRRSSVHQEKEIQCPMRGCNKAFISNAHLLLHLESGRCVSRLSRDAINRIMVKVDRHHIITNPSRLITGSSSSGPSTVIDTWATERAWNGAGYECYFCHRIFSTLSALNQHLRSPAHAEKVYRCPRAMHGCGAEFSTLSALLQHVESEQCGVCRFRREIDDVMEKLTSKVRRLKMN
ncbi:hypothetical protein BD413DRAFT_557139 [Trametes elegans]|nr:hypothetical protein BD413DRAFT_557139 [Trametes elegans]